MRSAVAGALIFIVFFSALEIVLSRHESRKLFVELQDLRKQKNDLNLEWGQLLLEQATWGTHGRIEEIAREQLDMIAPKPGSFASFGL